MSRSFSQKSNRGTPEPIQVIVLRSTGAKDQFPLSPSDALQSLKTAISRSRTLGRIPPGDQRLFHFGRELKTPGRSLEALGVTRFGVHLVHLHTVRPPVDMESDDNDDVVELVEGPPQPPPPSHEQENDSSDDDVQLVEVRPLTGKAVIDLADDDSDDDDQVEEEPIARRPHKRQRS